jgi:DNA replication and repair protein RecF
MTLRRVQVSDFRCLQSADIEFDPQFTLISGANASGKTSVLESIYVLGRGRSFRTRRLDNLIRTGSERFVVFGEVDLTERRIALGVEGSAEGVRARIGGERVSSLAELAAVLPVQVIDPEVHRLIEEGPSRRRRFLDWGVFHVEHAFVGYWQNYQQVLRQRNAALKLRQSRAAIAAWDGELLRLGEWIDGARLRYVEQLLAVAQNVARTLLGMELGLSYRSGWPRDLSFGAALKASWTADQEAGSTLVGPQRAELAIRLDGAAVKDRISRGQQKLLAAALLMAQVSLFPNDSDLRPTLLLDDPAAELDGERLHGLILEVSRQSVQLIVTSLSAQFSGFGVPGRRYHIENGRIHGA